MLKSRFIGSFVTCRRILQTHVSLVYEFDGTAEAIAKLVKEIENREDLGVIDWGISRTTLDDVFLMLCGNADHEG